jgi:hypothetical protein
VFHASSLAFVDIIYGNRVEKKMRLSHEVDGKRRHAMKEELTPLVYSLSILY